MGSVIKDLFFHHHGGFNPTIARWIDKGSHIEVAVAIGDGVCRTVLGAESDRCRFRDAVAEACAHICWTDAAGWRHGLPMASSYYDLFVQAGAYVVTWFWQSDHGRLCDGEAQQFLVSVGHLRTCAACGQARLVPREVEVCEDCGYWSVDAEPSQ